MSTSGAGGGEGSIEGTTFCATQSMLTEPRRLTCTLGCVVAAVGSRHTVARKGGGETGIAPWSGRDDGGGTIVVGGGGGASAA